MDNETPAISENEIELMRLESESDERALTAYHKQIDVALEILKMRDVSISDGDDWKTAPNPKLSAAAEQVILDFLQSARHPRIMRTTPRRTPDGICNFVEHPYPATIPCAEYDPETGIPYLYFRRSFISAEKLSAGDPVEWDRTSMQVKKAAPTNQPKCICCIDIPGPGYQTECEFRFYQHDELYPPPTPTGGE